MKNLPNLITTPPSNKPIDINNIKLPVLDSTYASGYPNFDTTNKQDENSNNPGSVLQPNAYAKPLNAIENPLYWMDLRYYIG